MIDPDEINAVILNVKQEMLVEGKIELKQRVDREAEQERLKFITAGAGQALTYQRKVEEATRAVDDHVTDPTKYPMLAASIGIDGDSIRQIAEVVLQMDARWAQVGSAIERARQLAKKAIDNATNLEDARAAVSVNWLQIEKSKLLTVL